MKKRYYYRTLSSLAIRLIELCAIIIAMSLSAGLASAATGGWEYDWGDEFNRTGSPIVSNMWNWDGTGSMVRDAKLDRANGYCTNGVLVLEAKRVGPTNYTSAAINTTGHKSFLYGRFEMRGRIDIRSGSWPAWWTTGVSGGWPSGGEIDMMEYYKDKLLFNVMNGRKQWASPTLSAKAKGGADWSSQFHTWIMEWDTNKIDLSLDGELVNHYPLSKADGTGRNGANPFRAPQNMRVNLAIGQQGGDPSGTEFPMKFEVDYIRVWKWVETNACVCTVNGGTGTGQYVPGTMVSLSANAITNGASFYKWTVNSGAATIASTYLPVATFTMPPGDVNITAVYQRTNKPSAPSP